MDEQRDPGTDPTRTDDPGGVKGGRRDDGQPDVEGHAGRGPEAMAPADMDDEPDVEGHIQRGVTEGQRGVTEGQRRAV